MTFTWNTQCSFDRLGDNLESTAWREEEAHVAPQGEKYEPT